MKIGWERPCSRDGRADLRRDGRFRKISKAKARKSRIVRRTRVRRSNCGSKCNAGIGNFDTRLGRRLKISKAKAHKSRIVRRTRVRRSNCGSKCNAGIGNFGAASLY